MRESTRCLLQVFVGMLVGVCIIYLSNLPMYYNKYTRRIGNDRYVAEVTRTPGKTFVKNILVDYGK